MKPSEMPTRLNPHRAMLRCIIIKLPKAKGKEKNFNTAKGRSYIQVKLHKTVSRFLNKKRVERHTKYKFHFTITFKRQKLCQITKQVSKQLLSFFLFLSCCRPKINSSQTNSGPWTTLNSTVLEKNCLSWESLVKIKQYIMMLVITVFIIFDSKYPL